MKKIIIPTTARGKKKADLEYEATKQEHRILDFRRYNIQAVLIDDYSEITDILREIADRAHLRDVFVSGSAVRFDPLGEDRIKDLCRRIGCQIIKDNLNLVSGFGLGIGGHVIAGAFDTLAVNNPERLLLRPFPQELEETTQVVWTSYRKDMIGQAGFCVFISGNKVKDGDNAPVNANGVLEEFKICKELKRYPIPVGATGYAAEGIWKDVNASLGTYYKHPSKVRDGFKMIGDRSSTNAQIVKAIFDIIKEVRQQ